MKLQTENFLISKNIFYTVQIKHLINLSSIKVFTTEQCAYGSLPVIFVY